MVRITDRPDMTAAVYKKLIFMSDRTICYAGQRFASIMFVFVMYKCLYWLID